MTADARRVAAVVAALEKSRKYRDLCDATLARTAADAVVRHAKDKDAIHAAKERLHQAFAAFVAPDAMATVGARVAALPDPSDEAAFAAACRAILALHASTAERSAIETDAWRAITSVTGTPRVVLDLACGLHPFALPLFDPDASVEWRASDVHVPSIAAINAFFAHLGRPATAETRDLLVDPPREGADVALLLKSAPTLERQREGSVEALARSLCVDFLVVSFPTASLSRKERGMREQYAAFAGRLAGALGAPSHAIEFDTETFFVLDRRDRNRSTLPPSR